MTQNEVGLRADFEVPNQNLVDGRGYDGHIGGQL